MKVEEIITERIVGLLERGTIPWQRPWSGGECPMNVVTKRRYRGVNSFVLACSDYSSPYWATYKQINALGGNVKKGEKGHPVVFWKWFIKKERDENGEEKEKKIPMLRYYTVFNVEQTINIDKKKIPALPEMHNEEEKIDICENIVKAMPKRPAIESKEQKAYYSPLADTVNMPKFESFVGAKEYYATLFHELTHSTGHEKRLNRKGVMGVVMFGSEDYSKEELIAEMGAAFLCGHCQIENKTIENNAAYIKSWLGVLKEDKKMVITAAAQAQKAFDFIVGEEVES